MLAVVAPQSLPQQSQILDTLSTAQAALPVALCAVGALLMMFGFKAYRWIVLLNFIALGFLLGNRLGERSQIGMVGAVIGAGLMGLIAMPLMKYAVAVCGGLVGAVIGMVIWAYCEQPLDMAWAGGLVGMVVLGMLSFILFKTTVILFTSVEGAAMFVLGTAALLMRYTPWSTQVDTSLTTRPVLLPLLVISTAILALFWQHQQHGLIGHDSAGGWWIGGGGGGGGGVKPAASEGKRK